MLPPILRAVEKAGHKAFDGQHAYNLNIVGIRSKTRDQSADLFDDWMTCTYRDEVGGRWITKWWRATTDPGKLSLLKPELYNRDGSAIIVPGQYRSAYVLGLHRNKYEALVQRGPKPIKIARDSNRDLTIDIDPSTYEEGYFGCNLHKAGKDSAKISGKTYNYSAGCQVWKREQDFNEFMDLCHLQIEHHPTWKTFTYTLLDEDQLA